MKLFRSRSGESGQVLVLTALVLAVVIGAVGLSVDIGFMMHTRTELQKDADAMALAGAQELCAEDIEGCRDRADTTARQWGVKNGLTGADPEPVIQFGVDCDGGTSNPFVITVKVKRYQASFFARVVGYTGGDIGACATAAKFAIGGLSGVRPFALEDNCIEEISYEDIVVIKHDSETTRNCDSFTGNFGVLAIDGTGASVVKDSVSNGTDSSVCGSDVPECTNYGFDTEPGNIISLKQGLDYVYDNTPEECDSWEEVVEEVVGEDGSVQQEITPQCNPWHTEYEESGWATRLWVIPVVDGLWDEGGSHLIEIKRFALVFLMDGSTCTGNDCDIMARFIKSSIAVPGDKRIDLYTGATVTAVVLIK